MGKSSNFFDSPTIPHYYFFQLYINYLSTGYRQFMYNPLQYLISNILFNWLISYYLTIFSI